MGFVASHVRGTPTTPAVGPPTATGPPPKTGCHGSNKRLTTAHARCQAEGRCAEIFIARPSLKQSRESPLSVDPSQLVRDSLLPSFGGLQRSRKNSAATRLEDCGIVRYFPSRWSLSTCRSNQAR